MNRLSLFILSVMLMLVACEKEDQLTPSMKDQDRVASFIDLTKPLIKEYYEKYNTAILYDFEVNIDVRFNLGNVNERKLWQNLQLVKFVRQTAIDSAIHILDSAVLSNFKDELTIKETTYRSDFKKKYFPNKIILTDGLVNENTSWLNIMQTESQSSVGGIGSLHAIGNDNAFIFNLDLRTMLSSTATYNSFRNDDLYLFLCYLMEKHNLYDQIPDEFYAYSINYYGKTIKAVQQENGEEPADIDNGQYAEYGFCSKKGEYDFSQHVTLPTRKEDVRKYINEMIHPNAAIYFEPTTAKLKIIVQTLASWGIDVVAIHPKNANLL